MKKINFSLKAIDPFFEKIEKISKTQRILIYVGSFVLLIAPIIYLSYLPKYQKIESLTKKFDSLKTKLSGAKRQAAQLGTWRKRHKKAKASFYKAKKALPQKKEIPTLLASISEVGQESGLDFIQFKPIKEKKKKFYAEIPVAIKVKGRYHDVASFFDKVSRLPRLVNINNIKLVSPDKQNKLSTTCTAVTYRFIEPKKKPAKKKPKRK